MAEAGCYEVDMRNGFHDLLMTMIDGDERPTPPTVDELAESYRVKLGLQPWAEHKGVVVNGVLRRSGKTTRIILQALAECETDLETTVLLCMDKNMVAWTMSCVAEYAGRLGLGERVWRRVKVVRHSTALRLVDPERGAPQRKTIELYDLP